ncbi:glycosyltransferase family 4 protein [Haladaptatus halobius]|uniref:glycosyltransferase family 4 protein n=1 Tax=Haladaptatus halobius TaxID=2884875 RepID=UPI001D0A0B61|nr:glycosyltransferase family 4 protein [Haladaptatus halobius]
MRIAFISNVVYPFVTGGAEKRIYEIGRRLADSGHDITIYGRHFWDGPPEITYEGMRLRAVSPERELYAEERRSITEAIEFAKDLVLPLYRHRDEHDVVVVSVFPYFPVLASKISTIASELPVVTTWHEVWQDYWNEYLGNLAPFGKAIEYLTASVPQYPLAVSGITADRLEELSPTHDDVPIVPNGIDYDKICSVDPAKNGFDVLFAGRLIKDKRVDRLLEAFDRVAPHNKTLGIIGEGPELRTLQAKAENLESTDQITFLGFLEDYNDVLGHMRVADIFVSPSTREGFGITYAEAMAAGCTVIGVDHPDSAASEVIGDAGFVVKPTINDLAVSLDAAIAGYCPSCSPCEQARQYDWDHVAERAKLVYSNALGH